MHFTFRYPIHPYTSPYPVFPNRRQLKGSQVSQSPRPPSTSPTRHSRVHAIGTPVSAAIPKRRPCRASKLLERDCTSSSNPWTWRQKEPPWRTRVLRGRKRANYLGDKKTGGTITILIYRVCECVGYHMSNWPVRWVKISSWHLQMGEKNCQSSLRADWSMCFPLSHEATWVNKGDTQKT